MHKVVSQALRKLPAPMKAKVKSSLWSLFAHLDDSFQTNTKVSVPETSLPAAVPAALGAKREERVVVVNELAVLSNPDILRLTLRAMFQAPELSPEQESLYHYLCEQPQLLASHDVMAAGIRTYLMGKLAQSKGTDQSALSLLLSLGVHEEKTKQSRLAYSSAGKTNPDAVFWPDPTRASGARSLFTELPYAQSHALIDRETPIGSAGSCFAMEIAHRLQAEKFHYVVTEPHVTAETGFSNSCARWGIIFNTPSFRQLVEKAFGHRSLPKIVWSVQANGRNVFQDPFREDIVFDTAAEYEENYAAHVEAARQALLEAKVFVLTLGMNEVWRLKSDGSVFSRAPWRIAANLVETKVLTVDENLGELQAMLDVWRRHNPELKIILSVSPVPLHATYRGEESHVITANCHSKSVLRVVAEEFAARNEGVYYFPSYEVVMYGTQDAWEPDQRHVSRHAVDGVMRLFNKMFVKPEALKPASP